MSASNLFIAPMGIWRHMPTLSASERRRPQGGVLPAVARFALSGIAALVLLGGAGVYLLSNIGRSEAIRNAKEVTALAGHGVIEPNLAPGLDRGAPGAVARLDRAVHGILGGRVVRVKLWRADGVILYSDEHRLIGSRYSLGPDEHAVLRSGQVKAEVSDLSRPENRFERPYDKLLEVYLPVHDASGRALMFETYDRYSSIAASGRRLWLAFAPAILGTLALLWVVQLPLVWRVVRRLREGQVERETLLRRAIDASELERRRIARDLHDGAVQDLAGVSYSLAAAADTVGTATPEEARSTLREAAAGTRRTIKELRSLLVDIYPPDLHRTGLEAALRDLAAPLAPRGIATDVDVEQQLELAPATEMLLYRCAQEALRNVGAHSKAGRVRVRVERTDGVVTLTVEDDGVGFDGAAAEGHLGLRLLADLAQEAGGALEVDSTPGSGTRVRVEAPL
jgi:two-component system NarL family sensor kinase